MPVILDQQDWPTWLGETEGDHTLMRPAPDGLLRVSPDRGPTTSALSGYTKGRSGG